MEGQLRQAQKMEAIGQLASGIAHDFNNILQVISGNSQLLQLVGANDPSALQHRSSEIIKAVERGVNLTRAMLAFARRQAIALRPVELHNLLRERIVLARNLLTKTQHLELQLHNHPLLVTADATLLQQVLFNLLANARDAMPDGGTVTVGTGLSDTAPEQAIGGEQHLQVPLRCYGYRIAARGSVRIFATRYSNRFSLPKGPVREPGSAWPWFTARSNNTTAVFRLYPKQDKAAVSPSTCLASMRTVTFGDNAMTTAPATAPARTA